MVTALCTTIAFGYGGLEIAYYAVALPYQSDTMITTGLAIALVYVIVSIVSLCLAVRRGSEVLQEFRFQRIFP
jgi:hypothetical protein